MDNKQDASISAGSSGDVTVSKHHPVALWFFFWGEFAERSSYYGMRAILFLYLTKALHYSDTDASPMYSAFKMACYFLPLVGGFIADRWLGRYWTIVGFSVPYVLGHFILGIPTDLALIVALALLAGGSGVIKPNISTLMGQTYDQQRPGQERLRSAAFLWFYFAINVGALISQLAMPELRSYYIRNHLAPEVQAKADAAEANGEDISKFATDEVVQSAYAFAFLFPAWVMVAALIVFAAGKRFYALETPGGRHDSTPEERKLQWQTLARLFSIFALVVLFWVGYEHNDTLWIAFIRDYVNLQVPGMSKPISPDQLQFLNALFVIILVPTFNIVFGRLDPQVKIFTPMRKILAGFLFTAAAIGIMSAAGFLAQGHTELVTEGTKTLEVSTVKLSVIWPALAYIVLTFGEVLLYGTMLELAYTAAPKSMKGFITACFLVTNTLGNFINVVWTPMYGGSLEDAVGQRGPLMPGQFFGITAFVVVMAAVAFVFVGKRFERGQAAQVQLPIMDSVESLCNNLVRSKLLTADALRTIHNRWLNDAKSDTDPARFSTWLVTNGFLTDFQLGVLQRGFAELLFLDDYKLLERIGQGRMAGVYKAVHKHGQVVAVKVLPLSRGKDSKTLARFQREARMALRLKHPNCVRTYQVGETQSGLHYIVMEYLDGDTLDVVLKQRGKLPVGEALHVLTQALRGVIHLDAAGLVHRDLKPANLMLVPPAGETVMRSQVKILDIGLGRAQFDEEAAGSLTREGTVLGTPLYMAPEQAQSASTVDVRADLYSLGCVLYHALTGQPPFPDNNAMMQILRHASDKPQPLSALASDVPPALQAVMDKLLAKDRAERFATPAAALQALEALGQTAPAPAVEANAPMPSYVKWLEQKTPADEKPSPPLAEPVAKAGQYEYVATPLPKTLKTAAFVQHPEELTTAQLARRRSLTAALVTLAVLVIGTVVWLVWWRLF